MIQNKSTKALQAVAFRLDADLHATLRMTAFNRHMSMTALIDEIIEEWIKTNKIKRIKHFNKH